MIVRTVVVGFLQTNCYLVSEDKTGEALIIDPGSDAGKIKKAIRQKELTPVKILLTHGHHDHTGAMRDLMNEYGIPVLLHEEEAKFMNIPKSEFSDHADEGDTVYRILHDGDEVELGSMKLKVLFTPGHTPGGVSYSANNTCFTGDTLFCDGVGRTDFEGGSQQQLMGSIRAKLMVLPGEVRIFPGHGPSSTIGRESRYF